MTGRTRPDVTIELVVSELKSGKSPKEVADKFGVSKALISRRTFEAKKLGSDIPKRRPRIDKITFDVKWFICEFENGRTKIELCQSLGLSEATIDRRLEENGLKLPDKFAQFKVPTPTGTKICRRCKKVKPTFEFENEPRNTDGICSYCKQCRSASQMEHRERDKQSFAIKRTKWRYNIDFLQLLEQQNGLCAMCEKEMGDSACIDHDHKCCPGDYSCGKCVRGIVHNYCNWLLGIANDNPQLLTKAAAYLTNWKLKYQT